ncbi:MAG TPA: hypothetical protein PK867_07915, partial [Pirellulales bacterium]|nr:hypothetical protein [Pirellulales bacterium]
NGGMEKIGAFCEFYQDQVNYALRLIADGKADDYLWGGWDEDNRCGDYSGFITLLPYIEQVPMWQFIDSENNNKAALNIYPWTTTFAPWMTQLSVMILSLQPLSSEHALSGHGPAQLPPERGNEHQQLYR